ncbi:MAG: hypothetical protein PHD83_01480 [Caldisericia bacterium]|nr:hypothetical protein [Caldisericia bacterium]
MFKIASNICFTLYLVLCLFLHTSLSANHLTNFQITETQVTNTSSNHSIQDVDGSKILWIGEGNEGEGLYLYDSYTHITTNLYSGSKHVKRASIKNDFVAAVFVDEDDIEDIMTKGCGGVDPWEKAYEAEENNGICAISVEGTPVSSKVLFLEKGVVDSVSLDQILCWDPTIGITTICNFASYKSGIAVYNSYVLWSDKRSGDYDIWAYDFNSGLTFSFVSAPGDQFLSYCQDFQTMFGSNFVVWKDGRNSTSENPDNYDIYGKNMITGQVFIVANTIKDETFPVANGDNVAWIETEEILDENNKIIGWNSIVKYKNLATGITYDISEPQQYKSNLLMSDSYLVWSESNSPLLRSSSFDINGYSFSFNTIFNITNADGDQKSKYISDNLVLWSDTRNNDFNDYNIYSGLITYQ